MKRRLMCNGSWRMTFFTILFVMAAALLFGTGANATEVKKNIAYGYGGGTHIYEYTGEEIKPEDIAVFHIDPLTFKPDYYLTLNTDYIIKGYANNINVGTATVTVEGIGDYEGTRDVEFRIDPKPIDIDTITMTPTSNVYNGEIQAPTISVPGFEQGVAYDIYYRCSPTFNANEYEYVDEVRQIGSYEIIVQHKDNYVFVKNGKVQATIYKFEYNIYSNEPYTCPHSNMIHYDAIAVTCEKAGYAEYYQCDDCKELFRDAEGKDPVVDFDNTIMIKSLGHDWGDWTVTKEANADADGERQHTCKRCGKVETDIIYRPSAASDKPSGSTYSGGDQGSGVTSGSTSGGSQSTEAYDSSETTDLEIDDEDSDDTESDAPTINIDSNKTYKQSKKITVKADEGIKTITINGKKIKIKKNKKSYSFKLSKYKKYLKKKGKSNKLVITDNEGNKTVVKFKVK